MQSQNTIATSAPSATVAPNYKPRTDFVPRAVPKLTVCDSSAVTGYHYDGRRKVLTLHVKGKNVFQYAQTTRAQFDAFVAAESKGKHSREFFFDNAAHPCTKIAENYAVSNYTA